MAQQNVGRLSRRSVPACCKAENASTTLLYPVDPAWGVFAYSRRRSEASRRCPGAILFAFLQAAMAAVRSACHTQVAEPKEAYRRAGLSDLPAPFRTHLLC